MHCIAAERWLLCSASPWLGMAGQELLQPTVTLTSASHHAQASFILLHDAYLAFRHSG